MSENSLPRVSIVVPLKAVNKNLMECLEYCMRLDYSDYEVIVLPDNDDSGKLRDYPKVRVIPTGPVGPSYKRDIALQHMTGSIVAFIDDDVYPTRGWLRAVVKHFEDKSVAAVGGPAVTPDSDSLLQKASGLVYESKMGGGAYTYRYIPEKQRDVDDYPSCNLIVRRSVMDELGGFDTHYWPGEDTKLCLDITKKIKGRIVYDPKVLVYHHRRELYMPHLKQVWSYAVHRGFFVKKFPETSLRLSYFLPSIFVLGLVLGPVLFLFIPQMAPPYLLSVSAYLLLALISAFRVSDIQLTLLVFSGIILTHITYGIGFIKGLFSGELEK